MTTTTIQRKPGRPADPKRAEARRTDILKSAAIAFGRDGYEHSDVADIAAAASLSKGAVYHYFESKEALFLATVDHEVERLAAHVIAAADAHDDPIEEIRAAVLAYLTFFADNPGAVELIVEERALFRERDEHTYFRHREGTMGRWRELFTRFTQSNDARPIDADACIEVLSNALYGTVFTNYFLKSAPDPQHQADQILDIVLHGVLRNT